MLIKIREVRNMPAGPLMNHDKRKTFSSSVNTVIYYKESKRTYKIPEAKP